MRHYTKLLLVLAALSTVAVWAQESYRPEDPDLLARLSYQRSPNPVQAIRQICLAVSQDGNYRLVSWLNNSKGPRRLEGKMSKDQLLKLKKLLITPGLRSLSGNHGGVIRDHAENFVAEISRVELPAAFQLESTMPSGRPRSKPGSPRWVQWQNADDASPFPAPIEGIIDWMKNFEPRNAKPLDYSELSNVCPSVGLSLVQPSIAENEHP